MRTVFCTMDILWWNAVSVSVLEEFTFAFQVSTCTGAVQGIPLLIRTFGVILTKVNTEWGPLLDLLVSHNIHLISVSPVAMVFPNVMTPRSR